MNDEHSDNQGTTDSDTKDDAKKAPARPALFSAKPSITGNALPAIKRPSPAEEPGEEGAAPEPMPSLPSLFSRNKGGTQRMHAVTAPEPVSAVSTDEQPTEDESPTPDIEDTLDPGADAIQPVAIEDAVPDEPVDATDEPPVDDPPTTETSPEEIAAVMAAPHVFGDAEIATADDNNPSTDVLKAEEIEAGWDDIDSSWAEDESSQPAPAPDSSQTEAAPDTQEVEQEEEGDYEEDDAPTGVVDPADVLDITQEASTKFAIGGEDQAPAPSSPSKTIRSPRISNPFMSKVSNTPVSGAPTFDPALASSPPGGLSEPTNADEVEVLDEVSFVEDVPVEEDATVMDLDREGILGALDMPAGEFEDEGATQVFNSSVGPAPTDPNPPAPTPTPAIAPTTPAIAPTTPAFTGAPAPSFGATASGSHPRPTPEAQQPAPPMDPTPVAEPTPAPDDFDDDFTAQKTELIQSPFERDIVTPKLRVLDGPTEGQEYFVNGLRATVGRGETSSVMIADIAMSRTHFELIKNADDSFLVRDLGSANGTLLNGAPIREASLFHGDRLEAGKTTLEFQNENAPPRPHRHMIPVAGVTMTGVENPLEFDDQTNLVAIQLDQSTRFFTRISLVAGGLCIPLCILLVMVSISTGASKTDAPVNETTARVEAVEPKENKAAEFYLQGVEAVNSREWEAARGHFERASETDPKLDIKAQLERISLEVEAQKQLAAASKAADEGDADKVLGIISQIPRESVYYDEAQRLTRDKRRDEVNALYEQAQQHLTDDNIEESTKSIEAILALVPNHVGATELATRVEARQKELEEIARKEALALAAKNNDEKNPDIKFDSPFSNNNDTKKTTSSSSSDLSEGYSLYKRKKFNDAASSFQKQGKKGKSLASYTRTVKSSWSAGSSAAKKKQWSKAVSQLKKARTADNRINKAHKSAIAAELADAYGQLGITQLKKDDYINARKNLNAGKKLGAKASSLTDLARGLEREATSLYIKAANKKKSNPDEAAKICRTIMRMVPSSSQNFKKAKRLILEL